MSGSKLEDQYREISSSAEKFGQELMRQLDELLREKNLTLGFPIQFRIKTWNSINGKLERKSLEIKEIKEVSDLIGLRATFLFQRDAKTVCDVIRENFKILKEEDAHERLGDSQFGYKRNQSELKYASATCPMKNQFLEPVLSEPKRAFTLLT